MNTFVTATVNPSTGGFISITISTPPILNSGGLAATGNQFLYVAAGTAIYGYSINSTTGALTTLAGSPFLLAEGRSPQQLVTVPDAHFLYAADTAEGIDAFQVDSSTGVLSTVTGSPFGTCKGYDLAVDSTGSFLYATDYVNGQILAYTIGPTGTLANLPGSPFALPGLATSKPVGIVESDNFLYVALSALNQIAAFSIDPTTGALSFVPGSPFPAGKGPVNLVSTGSFLYAVNESNGSVSGYSLNSSIGALTAIPGSPFFLDIATLAADPTSKYLYLSSSVGVSGYTIDPATGVLTAGPASVSNDGSLWMTVVQLPDAQAKQN